MDNAYAAALDELNQHTNFERSGNYPAGREGLGTARMEQLLAALSSPETHYPVLHIAGTKGKGSTAHLTAAVLRARGWRVGLYTSPHVICLRERVQIDGRFISPADFAAAFSRVRDAAAGLASRPTYFEMLTATAFTAFATAMVDVAVIEVGLGGRLDATNVATLPVAASCLTTVSLDHTHILGDTIAQIAAEKAGILRRGVPVVMAKQSAAARDVIRDRVRELDCPVIEIGKDILAQPCLSAPHSSLNFFNLQLAPGVFPRLAERAYEKLPLNLWGGHQWENAAAAWSLANLLCESRRAGEVVREDLVRAWKSLRIPGRFEVVAGNPAVILDGAHNPASAWALTETLRQYTRSDAAGRTANSAPLAVISISRDKDIAETLRVMLPAFAKVVFTANSSDRGATPEELLTAARRLFPDREAAWECAATPAAALSHARELAGENGLIVITGSFYLVGDLRPACLRIPEEC